MAKGFKNSIENVFNRMMYYSMGTALLTIVVGIILLIFPGFTNKVVGVFIGIVFLINGLNNVYKYFNRDGAKLYSLSMIFGVIYILLGAVIIVYPFKVMEFVTVCFGIYIIVNGLSKGNYALWLKKGNEDSWLITLASSILLVIIGLLIVFNPFASLSLTQIVGAFLILSGILDFTDTFLFKNRASEIRDIFW